MIFFEGDVPHALYWLRPISATEYDRSVAHHLQVMNIAMMMMMMMVMKMMSMLIMMIIMIIPIPQYDGWSNMLRHVPWSRYKPDSESRFIPSPVQGEG